MYEKGIAIKTKRLRFWSINAEVFYNRSNIRELIRCSDGITRRGKFVLSCNKCM